MSAQLRQERNEISPLGRRSGEINNRSQTGGACVLKTFCIDKANSPTDGFARRRMARVTVEDCIDKVENRFDLVLLASHRARMISSGSQITIDRDNDKNPVVSLREIAEKTVSPEDLKEDLIHSLQKYVEVDEPETDDMPLIAGGGGSVDSDDTQMAVEH